MPGTHFIHHGARLGSGGPRHGVDGPAAPPGSLAALDACLACGVPYVEVDVLPLAGDDFLLYHDEYLETGSDGSGPAGELAPDQANELQYVLEGERTGERLGLLSAAIDAACRRGSGLVELQLDLKAHTPLTDSKLFTLLRLIEPLRSKIRISSPADWALRTLRAMDSTVALGFDPMLYLDVDRGLPANEATSPFRMGAYGYQDDHPLASRRWSSAARYLTARAEALWLQAPSDAVWYIRAQLLGQCLADDFDLVRFLHQRGSQVVAWTLDPDQPHHRNLAARLIELGIDGLTSNDAEGLAACEEIAAVAGGD